MKAFEFLWNEFVYGGHWGSLTSSAIALSIMIILNLHIRLDFLVIVYLGTQCIYSYNHYRERDSDSLSDSRRAEFLINYHASIRYITIIYGILFILLLIIFHSWTILGFGTLLLGLGILFTYRAKSLSQKIVGFKSIYASFAWSLLVPFTILYVQYPIDISVVLLTIFVFFRFMVDTSFFDIKDIESDKQKNLKTYVLYFGKEKALSILHVINLISFIPLLIGVLFNYLPQFSLSLFFILFYNIYYIERARGRKVDIQSLSYIIVDGEYYYWPLVLLCGMIFLQ